MKILSHICIILIRGLRPLLGPAGCRYAIGCTDYAVIQLREQPLLRALYNIAARVLSCNPFYTRKEL